MIRIVDCGLGNVRAFLNAYKRLGMDAARANVPEDLAGATRIILPGVGAFDHAMEMLEKSGLRQTLDELVLGGGVPVLGVCIGMQIMATRSDEGSKTGLGWIPGTVRPVAGLSGASRRPMPHMGWNDINVREGQKLLSGFGEPPTFYFLHSYYLDCDDSSHVAATVRYGIDFPCAVAWGNIYGVLFHPEKSHHFGDALLRKFAEL